MTFNNLTIRGCKLLSLDVTTSISVTVTFYQVELRDLAERLTPVRVSTLFGGTGMYDRKRKRLHLHYIVRLDAATYIAHIPYQCYYQRIKSKFKSQSNF